MHFTLILLISLLQSSSQTPTSTNGICDCGKFLDLRKSSTSVDLQPLNDLLNHETLKDVRLYTLGYYGETDVLNGIILNELYETFNSMNSPDCLHQRSKFKSLLTPVCTTSTSDANLTTFQVWNDIFLYDSLNNVKIGIIFLNFKFSQTQSKYESRNFAAFSNLISSIFFYLGEEKFYDEYYGKESQIHDFSFNIEESDGRNEFDESILEIHSILSHQNIEMHENVHFPKEDLSIANLFKIINFGIDKIQEIQAENDEKMRKFLDFFKNNINFDENSLMDIKEMAMNFYTNELAHQNQLEDITTPRLMRKIKIFLKYLRQIERISLSKIENFIIDVTKDVESDPDKLNEIINRHSLELFDISSPMEHKIRSGSLRDYIKTLQRHFEIANSEIHKSDVLRKRMRDGKVTIPLPCDYKYMSRCGPERIVL